MIIVTYWTGNLVYALNQICSFLYFMGNINRQLIMILLNGPFFRLAEGAEVLMNGPFALMVEGAGML